MTPRRRRHLVARLGRLARDLLALLPLPTAAAAARRPPRVRLALAAAVPGAVPRLLPAGCVLLAGALTARGALPWLLFAAAAAGVTWRPGGPIAPLFALLTGLLVISGDDLLAVTARDPWAPWRLAGLVLAVHLVLAACALAAHVAWRARVELQVLARAALPVLGVQAVAQGLLLLAVWARAGIGTGGGREWPRVVAVVAVVGLGLVVLPREWVNRRRYVPSGRAFGTGGRVDTEGWGPS